ncbi:MAG TPA: hypothetical protein VIL99_16260 [Ignavibacteria bacterium]
MQIIFKIVAVTLHFVADITGLSYLEVNILVYFLIIPFTYMILIDALWGKHYLKIIFILFSIIFFIFIHNFEIFSERLFNTSVNFLESFESLGLSYTNSSVVFCVFVVLWIYLVLIALLVLKKKKFLIHNRKNLII